MSTKTRVYQIFEQGTRTLTQIQTALTNLANQGWVIEFFTFGLNGYAVLAYRDEYT